MNSIKSIIETVPFSMVSQTAKVSGMSPSSAYHILKQDLKLKMVKMKLVPNQLDDKRKEKKVFHLPGSY